MCGFGAYHVFKEYFKCRRLGGRLVIYQVSNRVTDPWGLFGHKRSRDCIICDLVLLLQTDFQFEKCHIAYISSLGLCFCTLFIILSEAQCFWILLTEMSAYDNVVGGKLKLKGKALDVKAPGMKKKKKKQKKDYDQISQVTENELSTGE